MATIIGCFEFVRRCCLWLADILPKKNVLAMSAGITTVGLLMFGLLDGGSFTFMALFAVVYGIGAGGTLPVRAPIVREYFGVKNFGAIYGVVAFFATFGSFICSPLTGWIYDTRGTYNPIWFIYAGVTAVGMALLLLLPRSQSLKELARGEPAA